MSDWVFSYNWRNNSAKCPKYLNEIYSIDKRWPKADSECQDFFHKLLIYRKLKPYINNIGKETFRILYNKFDSLLGLTFWKLDMKSWTLVTFCLHSLPILDTWNWSGHQSQIIYFLMQSGHQRKLLNKYLALKPI